jgi:glycosyltransferase involved in cell wall biosynthesis
MKWPTVSIIIPSYNQGKYIGRTIKSIIGQRYLGRVQIIVSDGGSTDETVEVLKGFPGVTWWSTRDRGFVDAVNKGLAVAKGDVIGIQSSDDFYLPGAFERAMKAIMAHGDCTMVSGAEVKIDTCDQIAGLQDRVARTVASPKEIAMLDVYIPQHCTFIRKEPLVRLGGLRESVDWCGDYDLFYRLLHIGPAICLPHFQAVYQLHPSQRTQAHAQRWVDALLRVVDDAERDPLLGSWFRLDGDDKQLMRAKLILLWYPKAGGDEGLARATSFAEEIVAESSCWPLACKEVAVNWLAIHRANLYAIPQISRPSRERSLTSRVVDRLRSEGPIRTIKLATRKLAGRPEMGANAPFDKSQIYWWSKVPTQIG